MKTNFSVLKSELLIGDTVKLGANWPIVSQINLTNVTTWNKQGFENFIGKHSQEVVQFVQFMTKNLIAPHFSDDIYLTIYDSSDRQYVLNTDKGIIAPTTSASKYILEKLVYKSLRMDGSLWSRPVFGHCFHPLG